MATFKVTGVPDFTQLKSEISKLQSKPVKIQVETQSVKPGIFNAQREINQLGTSAEKTGVSISNMFTKLAAVSPVYAAVKAFREALDTMKAVDTELVSIQKVTGYTAQQMDKLSESAYKLASQYGRTADEVLAAATTFARAGYEDQIEALAELSLLTQNVGDVSADTASKFIVAADAAWKLGGNETKLREILDGLNEITNRSAVDMGALTEAITVGGSVFAEAGESAQTFAALVGAGVASTQRSGSEIARALRTILMNIRQIRGETEDGELIDGESIANASKALKEYAGISTMANGQLRLASDVLDELAKKWENLDTVAQSAISEALAGKRQSNVLMALMGNWETVEQAIVDYANGAGSALEENEYYLNSWEAKSKQLSAAWTEFVSHLIETDTIKGALDGLIGLVELLDTDTGRLIVTVAALTAGVGALGQGLKWLGGTELAKNGKALAECFVEAASGAGSFSDILGRMNPKVLIAVAAIAALYGAYKLLSGYIEEANRSLASYDEEIDGVNGQLESNKKRIEEINNLPWEQRTSAILEEKKALEEENEELERQIELLNEEKLERARNVAKESVGTGEMTTVSHGGSTSRRMSSTFEKTVAGAEAYSYLTEQLDEFSSALDRNGEIADDIRAKYEENIAASARMVEALKTMQAAGDDLTDEQLALIAAYDDFVAASDNAQNAAKNHASALVEEAQQAGYTGQAMYDYAASLVAASNTALNVSQQMSALQALAVQAGYTAQAIAQVMGLSDMGFIDTAATNQIRAAANGLMRSGQAKTSEEAMAMARENYMKGLWGSLTSNYTPSGGTTSNTGTSYTPKTSTSSGSSDSARKNAQAAIKQLQKERDAELDVIQEQIDALQEQSEIEDRQAKIEEYKLDILKKQDAVMNARNERTVRQYNASTGQWEWVADATKVKKAEEDLENAKKDLREYERKTEIDLAVEELKTRQEAIKAAYQIKIDAWQDYLSGLAGAVADEAQYLQQSVANNKSAVDQIIADRSRLNSADDAGDTSGGDTEKPGIESPGGKDDTVYAPSTASKLDIQTMQAYLGVTPDGIWGTKSAAALKNSRFSSFDEMLRYFYSDGGPLDKAVAAVKAGNEQAMRQYGAMKQSGYGDQISYASVANTMKYDAGGILKGMGGIKATSQDEIVLPPKLAAKMLTPLADRTFKARLGELGFLYGVENSLPRTLTGSRITDSHNVTTQYIVNGAQIGAYEAEHMSMADVVRGLAGGSHHLQGFGNGI